jgi:hypothetical protein
MSIASNEELSSRIRADLTRRSLMGGCLGLVAAAAIPRRAGAATEAISPVMARLSRYMGEASSRALPPRVSTRRNITSSTLWQP